jgi:hypothetical protein
MPRALAAAGKNIKSVVGDEIRNPELTSSLSLGNNFDFLWISARIPRFVKAHDKSRNLAGMTGYGTACLAMNNAPSANDARSANYKEWHPKGIIYA